MGINIPTRALFAKQSWVVAVLYDRLCTIYATITIQEKVFFKIADTGVLTGVKYSVLKELRVRSIGADRVLTGRGQADKNASVRDRLSDDASL